MSSGPAPAGNGWTTASDLAEYTYCPRAHWYRHHAGEVPVDHEQLLAIRRGRSYHARRAAALGAHARWGYAPAFLALLLGLLLLLVTLSGWIP